MKQVMSDKYLLDVIDSDSTPPPKDKLKKIESLNTYALILKQW